MLRESKTSDCASRRTPGHDIILCKLLCTYYIGNVQTRRPTTARRTRCILHRVHYFTTLYIGILLRIVNNVNNNNNNDDARLWGERKIKRNLYGRVRCFTRDASLIVVLSYSVCVCFFFFNIESDEDNSSVAIAFRRIFSRGAPAYTHTYTRSVYCDVCVHEIGKERRKNNSKIVYDCVG